ncbi:FAD dependent oxidoreductase [Pseudovirgaria hyperparasitica]|uniref:L-2-hydroxyglutarate dehydrogenase, mitochondrial n=1 Tax=Pseudovirgaria hyperparasitica TaxID=470096 RepID=A0A6A6WF90_9PEZI|nr:FAD dependent oxidoreductase [Pseudovirgaria hyperparasitica]KAF2760650.1 FAD dependent oxidoreductase [Pseudovirgaria hyperparasitica]
MFSRSTIKCAARYKRAFSTTTIRSADFTHAVIGAGVVGLSIARRLQSRQGASTILIERHGHFGNETSSRNSEVIHAGLYYGEDSMKTKLCLKGKQMMYDLCKKNSIAHNNCGKWIVAQDDAQMAAIEKVHDFARTIGVPTHFVSPDEVKRREPDIRAQAGVLESTTTGIVDSHGLMQFLQGDYEENNGICAFNAAVESVEPIDKGAGGWTLWTKDRKTGEQSSVTVETLVNSAGLGAIHISNMILPSHRQIKPYYAKGSYFSYSLSKPRPSILVYPAPVPGHGGLGTHLTLDMSGRIRFGPDVEWVDDPTDLSVNSDRLEEAIDDIKSYLPSIDSSAIGLDYAGIRPKLGKLGAVTSGQGFQDFYIKKEDGFEGFINLLGIESPGLTSCLAIGEEVNDILY